MKYYCGRTTLAIFTYAFFCIAFLLSGIHPLQAIQLDTNLISNPTLNSTSTGWTMGSNVARDAAEGHLAVGSLRFQSSASATWASTTIVCLSGRTLNVNAWVKNALPADTTAGAIMQIVCYTSAGKKLGYRECRNVGTDGSWVRATLSVRIPYNAATVKLVLINKSSTSTAWFDDIDCRYIDDVQMRSLIRYPAYRDTVYAGDLREIIVGVEAYSSNSVPIESQALRIDLLDSDMHIVTTAMRTSVGQKGWENIGFSIPTSVSGTATVRVRLQNRLTAAVACEQSHQITILPTAHPTVHFDTQNRWIVDNAAYLPIGIFTSKASIDDLDKLHAAGFNTIMDYAILSNTISEQNTLFEALQARNMKILYSLKDLFEPVYGEWTVKSWGGWNGVNNIITGIVNTHKSNTALLGWFANDEKSEGYLDQIGSTYSLLKQLDPNHPCMQVLWGIQDTPTHTPLSDITCIDQYVVWDKYKTNAASVDYDVFSSQTRVVNRSGMSSRPIMMVSECGRFPTTPASLPPTAQDMLCLAYGSIVNGARGILFYNLTNLKIDGDSQWEALGIVGHNLNAIRDIVLGIDAPLANRVKSSNTTIECITRKVNGSVYVIAVNLSANAVTTVFTLPSGLGAIAVDSGLPGTSLTRKSLSSGTFSDTIEAAGTRVYRVIQ